MKIKFLLCLSTLVFLAPACSSSTLIPATATTLETVIVPTAEGGTATPVVTPTATEIAVGQIDPAHPEAGPKPPGEGITLDTTRHEWTRTVNGEVQYFSPEIQDWAVPHILNGQLNGGIPLIDYNQVTTWGDQRFINVNSTPLYFDVEVGVPAQYLIHPNADPTIFSTNQAKLESLSGILAG